MNKLITLILFFFYFANSYAQYNTYNPDDVNTDKSTQSDSKVSNSQSNDKINVGEFCYYESIDGQKVSNTSMPYIYHDFLEIKFNSGLQLSLANLTTNDLASLVKKHNTIKSTTKVLLGVFKPSLVSKTKYVVDNKCSIKIYYDGKNLIIEIPQLNDMFNGNTATNCTVYIPKNCINNFVQCLKSK